MNYDSHLGSLGIELGPLTPEQQRQIATAGKGPEQTREEAMALSVMPGPLRTTTRPWVIITLIAVPVIGALIYKWKK